jgi:hypothetical protein
MAKMEIKALEDLIEMLQAKLPIKMEEAAPAVEGEEASEDVAQEEGGESEGLFAPASNDEEVDELDAAKHDHESGEKCGKECPVKVALNKKLGRK